MPANDEVARVDVADAARRFWEAAASTGAPVVLPEGVASVIDSEGARESLGQVNNLEIDPFEEVQGLRVEGTVIDEASPLAAAPANLSEMQQGNLMEVEAPRGQLRYISPTDIEVGEIYRHPSETFIESVRNLGVLQPVIVTRRGRSNYTIWAGRRRVLAALRVGHSEIPAVVFPQATSQSILRAASASENMQRHPNFLGDAVTLGEMINQGRTVQEIAARLGLSERAVERRVSLFSLPPAILQATLEGRLPITAGLMLVGNRDSWPTVVDDLAAGRRLTIAATQEIINRNAHMNFTLLLPDPPAPAVATQAQTHPAAPVYEISPMPETGSLAFQGLVQRLPELNVMSDMDWGNLYHDNDSGSAQAIRIGENENSISEAILLIADRDGDFYRENLSEGTPFILERLLLPMWSRMTLHAKAAIVVGLASINSPFLDDLMTHVEDWESGENENRLVQVLANFTARSRGPVGEASRPTPLPSFIGIENNGIRLGPTFFAVQPGEPLTFESLRPQILAWARGQMEDEVSPRESGSLVYDGDSHGWDAVLRHLTSMEEAIPADTSPESDQAATTISLMMDRVRRLAGGAVEAGRRAPVDPVRALEEIMRQNATSRTRTNGSRNGRST